MLGGFLLAVAVDGFAQDLDATGNADAQDVDHLIEDPGQAADTGIDIGLAGGQHRKLPGHLLQGDVQFVLALEQSGSQLDRIAIALHEQRQVVPVDARGVVVVAADQVAPIVLRGWFSGHSNAKASKLSDYKIAPPLPRHR
jgi:hypothetical protein